MAARWSDEPRVGADGGSGMYGGRHGPAGSGRQANPSASQPAFSRAAPMPMAAAGCASS